VQAGPVLLLLLLLYIVEGAGRAGAAAVYSRREEKKSSQIVDIGYSVVHTVPTLNEQKEYTETRQKSKTKLEAYCKKVE